MRKFITLGLLFSITLPIYPVTLDQATFQVGQSFFNRKLYSEAEQRFLDIVRKYPDSSYFQHSLFYLGQSYAHMGNYKSSLYYYRLLLDKAKTIKQKQQAVLGIAKSWLQLGDHKKSGDFYSYYASEYPESEYAPAALYFAGIARERQGDNNNAIEKYRALLNDYPNSEYYARSVEKIALLVNDSPEQLWTDNSNNKTKNYELFDEELPQNTYKKSTPQLTSTPPSAIAITNKKTDKTPTNVDSQLAYNDTKYKAQLQDDFFITAAEPANLLSNSPRVINQVPTPPSVITQVIPSKPVVITQLIQQDPTIITQQVVQFITQQVEVTNEIIKKEAPKQNKTKDTITAKELEQYKAQWTQEYQQKEKEKEIEIAIQQVKELAILSSEKASVLQSKEAQLLEEQNRLRNMLYQDLNNMDDTQKEKPSTLPAFLTPNNVIYPINTNTNIIIPTPPIQQETIEEDTPDSTAENSVEENIEEYVEGEEETVDDTYDTYDDSTYDNVTYTDYDNEEQDNTYSEDTEEEITEETDYVY